MAVTIQSHPTSSSEPASALARRARARPSRTAASAQTWVFAGLLLLVAAHAHADSPIAIKAGATTPQSELTSPGMTLGGSLS
uniref:hypothetical protein n=1 Tax=Haliangium sp. TaxID=2663208 RepID=UPI003D0A779B